MYAFVKIKSQKVEFAKYKIFEKPDRLHKIFINLQTTISQPLGCKHALVEGVRHLPEAILIIYAHK